MKNTRRNFILSTVGSCLGALAAPPVVKSLGRSTKHNTPTASRPAILWASTPVAPDETVMLQAGNFSRDAKVEMTPLKNGKAGKARALAGPVALSWTAVKVLQRSKCSLKCVIPPAWPMGIYACRIVDGPVSSDVFYLNGPGCWWFQGDQGKTASPGGWLRLAGKCLNLGKHETSLQLENSSGQLIPLPLEDAETFDLKATVPARVLPGTYNVWLHNGAGGELTWQSCGQLQVANKEVWPSTVFNVKTLGLDKALRQAEANKGGIIYFPRGEYHVPGPIEIPDYTILRGEGKQLVSVYWLDQKDMPKSLIHGQYFALEDLTLYCQNNFVTFIRVDNGEFTMARARIRADHMFEFGREKGETVWRGRKLHGEEVESFASAIWLNGLKSFAITDCDILSGFDGLRLWNSSYGFIANNRIQYGRNGFINECSNQLIIENNSFEGHDMAATGNGAATYFGNALENALYKGNRFASAYGIDRELFTFDATGGAYFGFVSSVSGTRLTLAKDPLFKRYRSPATDWVNTAVCILDGKGAGQYRRVVKNSGREWVVDKPWVIEPDETSLFSIIPFRGRTLLINNQWEDGGAVQLYGTSVENIIAGNKASRMAGFLLWGLNARMWGWQPSWYNQILQTEIAEGNNYGHEPSRLGVWGRVETLASIKNHPHSGSEEERAAEEIWNYFRITPQMSRTPLARCNVLRNNAIHANGKIVVSENTADVVIENNSVANSEVGVQLDKEPTGIYLRLNRFDGVAQPVSGEGKDKATIVSRQTGIGEPYWPIRKTDQTS